MRLLLSVCLGLSLVVSSGVATCLAQSEPGAAPPAGPSVADIVIDEAARHILRNYYERNANAWVMAHPDDEQAGGNGNKNKKSKHKHKDMPPGIAKKDSLPPGIYKQLVRNGQIPPDVVYHPLPPDLIVQLPPLAPAYQYVIVDDRVLLIQAATRAILDVLQVPAL
jgi:hypothetical protein